MDTERPVFALTNFVDGSYPDGPSFIAYYHPRLEEWQRRNFDAEYFEKQIYPIMCEIKVCKTTLETIHIYNMMEDEWFAWIMNGMALITERSSRV